MDAWSLERFVRAQNQYDTYQQALRELADGRKHGHWMWFIFPQLAGLGRSPTAQEFGISGLEEAREYLAHRELGARLKRCVQQLDCVDTSDAADVLGEIDAMKLRSCLTLFAQADPREPLFGDALQRFFSGPDPKTLGLLGIPGDG